MVIPPLLEAVLTLIGMFVISLLIDWQIAARLADRRAVPLLVLRRSTGTRIVPRLQRVQELEWQSLSIVHEAMSMLRVIVSFGREDYEHQRFREQGQTAVDARVKLTVRQSLFTLGVQTTTAAGTALVLGFGAWHVLQGKISVGELIVLISYIASVYQPLEQISSTVGMLHEQLVQFDCLAAAARHRARGRRRSPTRVELDRARGQVALEDVSLLLPGPQRHAHRHLLRGPARANGSRSSARPAPARPR